jgi:hypothetical protein
MAKKIVRSGKRTQLREEPKHSWTPRRLRALLDHLAVTCNIEASCRKLGMSSAGLRTYRRLHPEFRPEFDAAIAEGYERLELKKLERGIYGTERPVFQGGRKVGTIVEYPDKVTLQLLRLHHDRVARARIAEASRAEDLELARLRLEERLSEMNRRMGGEG